MLLSCPERRHTAACSGSSALLQWIERERLDLAPKDGDGPVDLCGLLESRGLASESLRIHDVVDGTAAEVGCDALPLASTPLVLADPPLTGRSPAERPFTDPSPPHHRAPSPIRRGDPR